MSFHTRTKHTWFYDVVLPLNEFVKKDEYSSGDHYKIQFSLLFVIKTSILLAFRSLQNVFINAIE